MRQTNYTPREHIVEMRLGKHRLKLPKIVAAILDEIPQPPLRELVGELAMKANPIAPKRSERPHALISYIIHLLGRALGLRGEALLELDKMTVAFVEAGDLYDDAADGDYAQGHLHQLLAASSCLHFVATRCALRLGPEVADAWLESMHELPSSLLIEKDGDGSLSSYLEAVNAQATLFGALGRSAALAAGTDDATTKKVVDLAKLLYAYLQYPQDLREADKEVAPEADEAKTSLSANIMSHLTVEELRALFAQVHQQMLTAVEALPDNQDGQLLKELLSTLRPA